MLLSNQKLISEKLKEIKIITTFQSKTLQPYTDKTFELTKEGNKILMRFLPQIVLKYEENRKESFKNLEKKFGLFLV